MALPFALPHVQPAVVKVSIRAVAELLACCAVGVAAAKKGVLAPANVSSLSQLVYNIFLPCLLLTNVCKTVMSQPLTTLIPIPVIAVMQVCIGLVISKLALKVVGVDANTEQGREIKVRQCIEAVMICCCMPLVHTAQ